MIDGILLINKEQGITSYDVIRKLKRILPRGQKIGHAGTLDPFATGLLIILLGKYTKQMENILKMGKEYLVKAEFGYCTDTQDITGRKMKEVENLEEISQEDIKQIIKENFLGKILQTPPQFSAKKVKGKKAYEYARKGIQVKLKSKEVKIVGFKIVEYNWPFVSFNIVCTSGTYIRTLVHDLGEKLGVYATAIELKRLRIGNYSLNDAIESKKLESKDMGYLQSKIIS